MTSKSCSNLTASTRSFKNTLLTRYVFNDSIHRHSLVQNSSETMSTFTNCYLRTAWYISANCELVVRPEDVLTPCGYLTAVTSKKDFLDGRSKLAVLKVSTTTGKFVLRFADMLLNVRSKVHPIHSSLEEEDVDSLAEAARKPLTHVHT